MTTPSEYGISHQQAQVYKTFWDLANKNREKSFQRAPGPEVTSAVIKDAIVNQYPKPRY
jgi:hypothetical protein